MNSSISLIGRIKLLQVQSEPLKTGETPNRVYDPSALIISNQIKVNRDGVTAILPDENEILDAHHANHPRTRNKGTNSISIGFTGHYDLIREEFGDHLPDGVAGENIIIETGHAYAVEEMTGGILIRNEKTGAEFIFNIPNAMVPCNEFSHFVNRASSRLPAEKLKATLQFLENGRRGFIAVPEDFEDIYLNTGDLVYLLGG